MKKKHIGLDFSKMRIINWFCQQKELLITNINNMRAQEIRVAVLQQLFNEEIAKLKNLKESFCKQYKLDIEKFRKGLYRYDDVQGKFVEVKETKP